MHGLNVISRSNSRIFKPQISWCAILFLCYGCSFRQWEWAWLNQWSFPNYPILSSEYAGELFVAFMATSQYRRVMCNKRWPSVMKPKFPGNMCVFFYEFNMQSVIYSSWLDLNNTISAAYLFLDRILMPVESNLLVNDITDKKPCAPETNDIKELARSFVQTE